MELLPFSPGLVGGHCIGVDPYYLTHKAQSVGYHPQVILAGRHLNEGMGFMSRSICAVYGSEASSCYRCASTSFGYGV